MFRRRPWTRDEEERLYSNACASLIKFIQDAQPSGGSIEWTMESYTHPIQLFSGKAARATSICAGAMHIRCTLEDAIDSFERAPSLYGLQPVESALLLELDSSQPHEHLSVQWMSLPEARLLKPRDVCVVEIRRMFEHNGQRGYACLVESVDIPECPSFEHSHGLVRATARHTGFIFTELQVGVLHVMQCMHLDWSGTAPAWVAKSFCKRRISALPTVLDRFFTRRRSSFDQTQMMASTSKKHCGSCYKSFGVLESKKYCIVCGVKVCKTCVLACHVCASESATSRSSSWAYIGPVSMTESSYDDYHHVHHTHRPSSLRSSSPVSTGIELERFLYQNEVVVRVQSIPSALDSDDALSATDTQTSATSKASSVVWREAISAFHHNLGRFKRQHLATA
ncbi:unnamed protein product [Aphanomyces euteiches]